MQLWLEEAIGFSYCFPKGVLPNIKLRVAIICLGSVWNCIRFDFSSLFFFVLFQCKK